MSIDLLKNNVTYKLFVYKLSFRFNVAFVSSCGMQMSSEVIYFCFYVICSSESLFTCNDGAKLVIKCE